MALGLVMAALLLAAPAAHAEDEITIRIAKQASLGADGRVMITVFVRCGPLPGAEDFIEAHAGVGQARTGAGGEGGLDGTVVCDGVERVHTAHFSPLDGAFRHGPAVANVSIFACRLVGDDQVCFSANTSRRIIITGRR
ncbi:hypothetical protein [Nocardioides bizhenqiangii]|uniref:Uncharacterized protein n=1 Tax=Nocardioides bizhenqiangii TaxID=3095076 RepID=A0ABZ0ZL66_9ACTN|nr:MULTISPECIES: hypothetical protein [unclassified Nocardioides]MDZ5620578.1 hypothetical protein [Nocardioides sp. HM23]WQQ24948.1 hypothetical protein SHK19_13335 [Nocardioides sp. HM61]